MPNALLFLWGFASITGVYEIAKSSKRSNTAKFERTINSFKRYMK